MENLFEFQKFSKIPRLSREMVITEKVDGTNGQIYILHYQDIYACEDEKVEKFCALHALGSDEESGLCIFAGSRKRWLTIGKDNYGFAAWVSDNAKELLKLGAGRHFGEWYGQGIQRKYGLQEKRFALFNVKKWTDDDVRPSCCGVVPILFTGDFTTENVQKVMVELEERGSFIVPGFKDPEGIVIYHKASGQLFKKTIKDDEKPKGQPE